MHAPADTIAPTEAAWRRRLRAPRLFFPAWARDAPHRLLYRSTQSGRLELHAWDRSTGSHRQVTDRPQGTANGRIDPGGEWVWWFDDEAGSEFGIWMVEPFAGGTAVPPAPSLAPAYAAGIALGADLAVVGRSGADGSSLELIRPGVEPRRLYQHAEEAWAAGISADDSLVTVGHSEHGDTRHPALRVLDLDGDRVGELWDGPGLGVSAGPWSPRPGDGRLIVQHERLGLSRPAIWEPAADRLNEIQIDLPGEAWAGWYPDAQSLLIQHDHAGRSQLLRFDLSEQRLEVLTGAAGSVGGAAVRPEGDVWEDWSDGGTPPRIRSSTLTITRTVLAPPGESPPSGVPYLEIRAGEVPGFLAEPRGPRPHPTVFLVHGGPEAHSADAFSPRVQAWVDHSFAVALVNYRGSSGYGKEWRDALQGNPGLTEVEDVTAMRDQLVRQGVADPRRLVLAGGSWGGYITLLGAGVHPERWSLAIADVPVADYAAAFEDEMEPLKAYDRALFGGSPTERPEFYRERSPITYADRVTVPLMILAGRNDPRCPLRQIHNYVRRMADLGKSVELYEFEAGHASLVVEEQIRQLEAQIAFAARHLATPAPL